MTQRVKRRTILKAAASTPLLAACSGVSTSGTGGEGSVDLLSTQFQPVEERQRFEKILADHVKAALLGFNPVDASVFATTVQAQVDAGQVKVSLLGGLHGDLAPQKDRLMDLDDVADQTKDRQFPADLLDLGKLGGGTLKYVPWMQATYLLAINKAALEWVPSGGRHSLAIHEGAVGSTAPEAARAKEVIKALTTPNVQV